MYYNPDTDETLSLDELKELLNASIPEEEEEIDGWHIVYDEQPAVSFGYAAVQDAIVERDGKYFQTYRIEKLPETAPAQHPDDVPDGVMERIALLESGLMELAAMLGGRDYVRR